MLISWVRLGMGWETWESRPGGRSNGHCREGTKPSLLWSKSLELLKVSSKPLTPSGHREGVKKSTSTSSQEVLLGPGSYTNTRRGLLLLEEGRKLLPIQDVIQKIQGGVWLPEKGGAGSLRKPPNWNWKHKACLRSRVSQDNKETTPHTHPSSTTRIANLK